MSQTELFYPAPYLADSVDMEITPVLCPECNETEQDCFKCSNCESCSESCECVTCERCDESVSEFDTRTVQLGWRCSEIWCDDCASSHATCCDGCDDYHASDSYVDICGACDVAECESCRSGGYSERNDSYYCESCYQDNEYSPFVSGYHDGNPYGLNFHGEGSWHMGIELELSADYGDAERILTGLGGHENVHFEEDGSVHDGFEMIFQPRTLSSWQAYANSREFGTLSRFATGGDHGFHVHVSKSAFKSGNAVRRFADIMTGRSGDEAKSLLETLAGRTENPWAMFEEFPRKAVATKALKKSRYGTVGDYVPQRYRGAVNLNTGKPTFEIRLGCGTTNPVTVLAWLEFIGAAVEWSNALNLHLEALGGCDTLALVDFMADKPQYQHAFAACRTWEIETQDKPIRRRSPRY